MEAYHPTKGRINEEEYILCAAIKRIEPRKLYHENENSPYWKGTNDILDIEIGFRHHDIYQRFFGEVSNKPDAQGFYTSKGRFVSREEGMKIAYKVGQVSEKRAFRENDNGDKVVNELFSEDLY